MERAYEANGAANENSRGTGVRIDQALTYVTAPFLSDPATASIFRAE
jgi:hypothetical protein